MFRLASLIGVACLALAACVMARNSANPTEDDNSSDQNSRTDQKLLTRRLARVYGGNYHAQFSLN